MCSLLLAGIVFSALACSCGNSASARTAAQDLAAGVVAQKSGNVALATTSYTLALSLRPRYADALFDLGDVEQLGGITSSAESHYEAALAADPLLVPALYNLATLEAHASPREAAALYRRVVALSPDDADARFNLGLILRSLGLKSAGSAQIELAVAIDPALKHRG
jgi:protein O-GlcNAc transferase